MSEFAVDPGAVHGSGVDFCVMADIVESAVRTLEGVRLNVTAAGAGWLFSDITMGTGQWIEELEGMYRPGGNAHAAFDVAGVALQRIARDYETTDVEQAARYDAKIDNGRYGHPRPVGAVGEPGPDPAAYAAILATAHENHWASVEAFESIFSNVEYVVGLEWIGEYFDVLGFPSPFEEVKAQLAGEWQQIGRALAAVSAVRALWGALDDEVLRTAMRWQPSDAGPGWSGNAAEHTFAWTSRLALACTRHGEAIEYRVGGLEMRAMSMANALDTLIGMLEDLAALLPRAQGSVEEFVEDLTRRIPGGLGRLLRLVMRVLESVRLTVSIAMTLLGLVLGARGHDTDYPSVELTSPQVTR